MLLSLRLPEVPLAGVGGILMERWNPVWMGGRGSAQQCFCVVTAGLLRKLGVITPPSYSTHHARKGNRSKKPYAHAMRRSPSRSLQFQEELSDLMQPNFG